MHGILVIDKPRGLTSHDVVRRVRRALGTRRVGHTGTLDPLATGVLPVAVGEGTRLVQFLLEGDKEYRATLRLGEITDTQDATGKVLESHPVPALGMAAVIAAAAGLTGEIRQIPPMYSALKKDGVPLYRLARQGLEVERQARAVTVYRLGLERCQPPEIELTVACSKGTYVRTLAHDLGLELGCGAHLTALRRTRSGPFAEADCLTLEDLEAKAGSGKISLLGPREALPFMTPVILRAPAGERLRNGIPPALEDCEPASPLEPEAPVLLLVAGQVRAVARFAPARQVEKRGDFQLLRVFPAVPGW